MKINVAYLRVSTEAQTEKYGLELQKQKIIEFCEKRNIVIGKWYIDGGFSGSRLERPQITELLLDAQNGLIEQVFIYKLDRMSRDVVDTLTLLYKILPQYGVKITSMTEELSFETPMDKVMVGVNALMGQYEREVIYMRTRAGMLERVKRGLWMGGGKAPFGYWYDRNDGILHPKQEEADIVRQIYELYINGMSCEKICCLTGLKSDIHVRRILSKKLYIGIIEYKGNEYRGLHQPIISEALFYEAQECKNKRCRGSYIVHNHILTGLCYCGKCGARMRYHIWSGIPRLVCYSQLSGKDYMKKSDNCTNSRPYAEHIEAEVEKCFKQFAIKISDYQADAIDKIKEIENRIKKTKSKIKRLYNAFAENDDSDTLLEVIREEESRLKEMGNTLKSEQLSNNRNIKVKAEEISKMSDIWDDLSNAEKNKILKECIERIEINGDDVNIFFKGL